MGLLEEAAEGDGDQHHRRHHHKAHRQVEDERSAVVRFSGVLLADQRIGEAAVHDAVEHRHQDHDVAYQAVLVRGKQARQHKAHQERYALICYIIHGTP